MKRSKRKLLHNAVAAMLLCGTLGFSACDAGDYTLTFSDDVKNVILLIGDGMGENHIQNTLTYFDLSAPQFLSDRCGSLATHSKNKLITDSAAAGTALATGQKAKNRTVAYADGEHLTQITTLAKNAGKRVGVITTDYLYGATPAAFSAHAESRYDRSAIAASQAMSNVDLLIGEEEENAAYHNDFHTLYEDNGYTYVTDELSLAQYIDEDKLVATLPNVRSQYNTGNEDDFQLQEMAQFAVEFLENDNGFFLMIESAHIDKFSHKNELIPALCEVRSLFDTVDFLYDYIDDGKTVLLITADHETGMLKKAANKAEISNALYGWGGHTARDVPFFIKNATFTYSGAFSQQNTVIFDICKQILGV